MSSLSVGGRHLVLPNPYFSKFEGLDQLTRQDVELVQNHHVRPGTATIRFALDLQNAVVENAVHLGIASKLSHLPLRR
jgi:hypothetical protein